MDITLCSNDKCVLRESCYRFIAKRDDWQSQANFVPLDGKCAYFIEAKAKSQVRRLDIQTGKAVRGLRVDNIHAILRA